MSEWKSIVKLLTALSYGAELPASPERAARIDAIQDAIIENLDAIEFDGQRATALEVALTAGASRLLVATPKVEEDGLTHLSVTDWEIALKNCSGEDLSLAMQKGLDFTSGFLMLLDEASKNESVRGFVLGDMARRRYWFDTDLSLRKLWFEISDQDVAAKFLKLQAEHHPHEVRNAFAEALKDASSLRSVVWQVAMQDAGVNRLSDVDPLGRLIRAQPSHHAGLKLRKAHENLAAVHAFYTQKLPS